MTVKVVGKIQIMPGDPWYSDRWVLFYLYSRSDVDGFCPGRSIVHSLTAGYDSVPIGSKCEIELGSSLYVSSLRVLERKSTPAVSQLAFPGF